MNYKFIIITCLTFLTVDYSELIMAEQPTPTQPDITNSNIETIEIKALVHLTIFDHETKDFLLIG